MWRSIFAISASVFALVACARGVVVKPLAVPLASRCARRPSACQLERRCCNEQNTCPRYMTKSRLDAQTDLLLLECLPIGYNRDFTAWIVGPDGTPKPAPLGRLDPSSVSAVSMITPKEAKGSVWLTSPSFKTELRTTYCARAFCDAGTEVAYRWTEGELRVHRISQRDDGRADSIERGTWPIVWPSSATCA
jgi:hypothetical protein